MRAVVTGIGIVSTLGCSRGQVAESLRIGRSGVVFDSHRKELGFRSGLTGAVRDFELRCRLSRRERKRLPEFGLWAWQALMDALDHAGLSDETFRANRRAGIILGNDSSAVAAVEQVEQLKEHGESRYIGSGYIFQLLNSTLTLNFATMLGIAGTSLTVSCACASGGVAISQAADLIERGVLDLVICGGAQEISWQSMCSFDALGAFSTREESPEEASRPFDAGRDGLVPSGGAAVLVLESEVHAAKRGARVLASIEGSGYFCDGHHVTVPSGRGLEDAMSAAMSKAGREPAEIDLLMAHATSTPSGDEVEARVIRDFFSISSKGQGPLICATKALTGHEFWMAGASQVIYAVIMASQGFVAGHVNLEEPDPEARLLNIPRSTRDAQVRLVLCNASGFGGTNSSLVVRIEGY